MRKFQGYTATTLLDEYALRFYALIEQSVKLDASDAMHQLVLASSPSMSPENRQDVMNRFEQAAYDIIEDIKNSKNTTSDEEIKEAFDG